MIDEYYAALKVQIEAGQGLAGRVYDTVRLDANGTLIRDNYVVLYSPVPLAVPQDRATLPPSFAGVVEFESDIRVVGTTAATVRQMMPRVLAVVGQGITIAGRQAARLRLGDVGKVRPDESVKPFLYYADMSVEWTSRP